MLPENASGVLDKAKVCLYRGSALYWRIRSRGRVAGSAFRLIHPERLRIGTMDHVIIGRGAVIDTGARLGVHGTLTLGDWVYIGRDAVISVSDIVTIGARTRLPERLSIHERNYGEAGAWSAETMRSAPILVGSDCWIGANVVLTAGASVGDAATIGAHGVVTGTIPADATAVGVPARVVKQG